ncbi:MAG: BREX-4 system phosphatase PglZ [Eubacterium sp.]|nr:BREX-4 system phosphatase PglZ [Eubacterium sp.]
MIELSSNNVIKESQEWLKLWKNAALLDLTKPVVCYSDILQEWYQNAAPDNAFQIDIISSVPSYIEKIYGVPIDFEYIEAEKSNWKRLLEFVKLKGQQKFSGIKTIDSIGIYKKWIETNDDFETWLLFNYVKNYLSYTFLARVFRMMKAFSQKEFQKCVWNLGYAELNEVMYLERKQILGELSKYKFFSVPEDYIRSNISKKMSECSLEFNIVIDDFTKFDIENIEFDNLEAKSRFINRLQTYFRGFFLDSFSGFSDVEKELIINFVRNGIIEYEEVKEVYPSLYAYIGKNYYSKMDNDWLTNYLKEYRISKLCNKDTNKLKEMVGEYNSSDDNFYKWYFSLTKQDVYIRNNSGCPVYVLDGVGAEYVPYLEYLLKKNNYKVKECNCASSSLPSITSVNSNKIKNYHKWIRDFDKHVIHDEIYYCAHNIQKSLTVLERIIETIVAEQMGEEFIITADHGATARARWTKPVKKYSFLNSDHEGRCCKANGMIVDKSQDYLIYEDVDQWIISLRDISLNNNPKYEDHGGATIEEVVVPYIHATANDTEDELIEYTVTPFKISVDGLNKNISFSISPKPDCVELFEQNGNRCEVEYVDDMWNSCLSSGKQQTVRLRVDQKEVLFDVVSNVSKIIKEDDGFDD